MLIIKLPPNTCTQVLRRPRENTLIISYWETVCGALPKCLLYSSLCKELMYCIIFSPCTHLYNIFLCVCNSYLKSPLMSTSCMFLMSLRIVIKDNKGIFCCKYVQKRHKRTQICKKQKPISLHNNQTCILDGVPLRSDSQQSAAVVRRHCWCFLVCVAVVDAIVDDLQLIINLIHHPYFSLISDKNVFHVAVEFWQLPKHNPSSLVPLFFMLGCHIYKAG